MTSRYGRNRKQIERNATEAIGNKEVTVTVRKLIPLAAVVGFLASGTLYAEPKSMKSTPAVSQAENQKLADTIAAKLKSSGVAKGAKIGIECKDGIVLLSGTCTSAKQHEEILRQVTQVKGISRIESEIGMNEGPIKRTAGENEIMQMPASSYPIVPVQAPGAGGGLGGGVMQEPAPLNGGMAMAPLDPSGPSLPPYAWPTYAPYNNMSRVAYPGAYPYQAFPYIGPFYPFPKVPLGWRKVVLEWDDGHWYLGRLRGPQDYWRVRFW